MNCILEQIVYSGVGTEYVMMLLSVFPRLDHTITMEIPTYNRRTASLKPGISVVPVEMDWLRVGLPALQGKREAGLYESAIS